MTPTPTIDGLQPSHARAARHVAEVLREAGQRGWVVGGAVRDLTLGRTPKDVDMVSAALPEEVEALFPRTLGIGKAFGIICVLFEGETIELATFRSERGHSDGRRPDEVLYGASLEEDAARRDFTCNALFLDPLTNEVRDPFGGVTDLSAGRLATVGDAERRFAEDGLRLLRMARFEAALGLEPAEGLHAAARSSAEALRGVSAERVLEELRRLCGAPQRIRGARALFECELLPRCVTGWGEQPAAAERLVALAGLNEDAPAELALAVLLEPAPLAGWDAQTRAAAETLLDALHASRELRRALLALWDSRRAVHAVTGVAADPAQRARLLREDHALQALDLALVWAPAHGSEGAQLKDLREWLRSQTPEQLSPAPHLTARDLAAAGVAPGPLFGRLLRELEDAQLRGELVDRVAAQAWLACRLLGPKPGE